MRKLRHPLTSPPWLTLALLVCTLLLAAPAAAQDTAQQVVDRAIAFHGGDLYESTETSLTLTSLSGSFRVISRVDGGRFDHTVIGTTREGAERKIRSTNDTVELWLDGVSQKVRPKEEQRLRDVVNARVYFPFLPYRLNDPGVHKRDLGFEEWDGRRLHKIKVTFESGSSTDADDEYLYWFDPETGRLEQFAYSFHTGGGGLRLRKGFNYRRVGGILFMDSENWGIDGRGHDVEEITPELAEEGLERISTVTVTDVEVRPLHRD
jgi:hypothetical protein